MSQNPPPFPTPDHDPNQNPAGQQFPQSPQQGQQYPAPGQTPEQASRFGTSPYAAQGGYGAPVERPAKLDLLLKLTLGSLAIWLLSSLSGLIFPPNEDKVREAVRQQAEAMGQPVDDAALEASMGLAQAGTVFTTLIILVLGVGLYLLVYLPLRKGKNWARILGIVLAILGLAFTAYGFSGLGMYDAPGRTLSIVVGVLFFVVNVFWLVTAFNKDVSAYTRAMSEQARH